MSQSRKEAAIEFLNACASGKNIREAWRKHVAPGFRHHNPWFPADAESLMVGMQKNAEENPTKVFEVKRALEDGDCVAVHSHLRMKPADRGMAVVHIFRFDKDRVVELWDLGMEIPDKSINANGVF